MAEQGDAAIGAGQGEGGIGDAGEFVHQRERGAVDSGDVARHRHGVAAVALEIEADGDVAGLGERQRKAVHQLPRPGKAMRDDDHVTPTARTNPEVSKES